MSKAIMVIGTLDTKGDEVRYLKEQIEARGHETIVVDVGVLNETPFQADVARQEVAKAGGLSLPEILASSDRRVAVQTMMDGAIKIANELHQTGKLSGVVAVGGGTGTHICTGVMRTLPLGVPKLMVSTVASRDMSQEIGTKDITMMHSVIDMLGLNAVSKKILANAAGAIVGMVETDVGLTPTRPLVGLTVFGFCTEGAMHVKSLLEARGYEMVAFHANGTGGMAMEDLVDQGVLSGVLDFATHEFADQLYGGYCGGIGPGRLEAAGRRGIPQVVVPGGLDCIVLEFDSPETIPPQFRDRKIFWYDFRSGVRTSKEEMKTLAQTIAGKLNKARGPVKVVIPLRGWSEADGEGAPLHEPETNQVFIAELKRLLRPQIEVIEVDAHINEPEFAEAAVATLDEIMHR
ncbi:MAG TPA: UPF0261 family protein [Anaerolineae bacterium]|nr:UPF0261 family protein [Anaerolineae bacterium]